MSNTHWLYRKENHRKLWFGGGILLLLTVLAQWVFEIHGQYEFEAWLGFFGVFGFVSCVLMVLFAKLLGLLIKRKDNYYHD